MPRHTNRRRGPPITGTLRHIKFPREFAGSLIGKGGSVARSLQSMHPTINFLNVNADEGLVVFCSDSDDAERMLKSKINSIVNEQLSLRTRHEGYHPQFSILVVDGATSGSVLRLESTMVGGIASNPELIRGHFVSRIERPNGDDDEQLSIALSKVEISGHEKHKISSASERTEFCSRLAAHIQETNCLNETDRHVKVSIRYGKTYITKLPQNSQKISHEHGMLDESSRIRTQFDSKIITEEFSNRVRSKLIQDGFEIVVESITTVIYLVNVKTREKFNISLNTGGDKTAKLEDDGSAVLKRVLHSKNFFEVLELKQDNRNIDDAAVKKAFKLLSLKIHPDKNSHQAAHRAFVAARSAFDNLETASLRERQRNLIRTNSVVPIVDDKELKSLFETASDITLPEVKKFIKDPRRIGFTSFLRCGGATTPEFRVMFRSDERTGPDQAILSQLENAWKNKTDDGYLTLGSSQLQIHLQRVKNTVGYSDGRTIYKFTRVRIRHWETADSNDEKVLFGIKVTSLDLKEMLKSGAAEPNAVAEEVWAMMESAKSVLDAA